jgi:hypothetical protein
VPGPAGTPAATADGRPFVPDPGTPPEAPAFWWPDPPREGDPVYCLGALLGKFHGDRSRPGDWYVQTLPAEELPPDVAAWVQAGMDRPAPVA